MKEIRPSTKTEKKASHRKFLPGILCTVLCAGLLFPSCKRDGTTLELSGIEHVQTYPFKDFQKLDVAGIFHVELIPYTKDSVVVRADSILFPYVKVEQKGNKLYFSATLDNIQIDNAAQTTAMALETVGNLMESVASADTGITDISDVASEAVASMTSGLEDMQIHATIFYNALSTIKAMGTSQIQADQIWKADEITLELLGASAFKGNLIASRSLNLKLLGASRFEGECTAAGKADISVLGGSKAEWSGFMAKADITASGASDVEGFGMIIDELTASASGASSIQATVSKSLNGEASGASSIRYKGTPKVQASTSGASSVRPD